MSKPMLRGKVLGLPHHRPAGGALQIFAALHAFFVACSDSDQKPIAVHIRGSSFLGFEFAGRASSLSSLSRFVHLTKGGSGFGWLQNFERSLLGCIKPMFATKGSSSSLLRSFQKIPLLQHYIKVPLVSPVPPRVGAQSPPVPRRCVEPLAELRGELR